MIYQLDGNSKHNERTASEREAYHIVQSPAKVNYLVVQSMLMRGPLEPLKQKT